MGINRIIFSFTLALVTNGIVAVGAMSFFYWINTNASNTYIAHHRHGLTLLVSFAYLAYLFLESLNNTYYDKTMFGYHWTFLNMIILAMFFLNLQVRRWSQTLLEVVLMIAYFALFAKQFTVIGVLACIAFALCLYISYRYAEVILHRRALMYGSLVLIAGTAIMMVYQMEPRVATDAWFWARQIGGIGILGIVVVEYNNAMTTLVQHTDQIAERATIDDLTGLLNYGSFTSALMAHFTAYKEEDGAPYSVFEIDLDFFKRINDTYDHLAGNEVLQKIADALTAWTATLEVPAKAYRLGGEEFAIIVEADLDPLAARNLAKSLQRELARLRFSDIDPRIRLTCSMGQARVLQTDYTHHDVYKAADKNLYQSKRDGRNLVTVQPLGETER